MCIGIMRELNYKLYLLDIVKILTDSINISFLNINY